ncbi:MAG: Gfo/Idh/MocA family oxidoreductase [Chthonomonadales bacterium]|nr:Gfo/Idh/MocA family oxidoreductase [Chthonomonadales bacterium]
MRIGVVDLDTSHPQNWIPIERELGHEVLGVWDGGAVHPPEYVAAFARQHDVPRVYERLEVMAADVDVAVLHGCDWDTHVEKARPFVEAGKGVLIDKPIAGRARDLRQLAAWVDSGARITGGSSLRFCVETREWAGRPAEERGQPHTALCGCAVDEMNYGIHAYALLAGILGPGAASVRHIGGAPQRRVLVRWPDGRCGIVIVGAAAAYHPFHATIVGDREVTHYRPNAAMLYRALLEATLPYLAGEAPAPVAFADLVEPERWAIAAMQSWCAGDREVPLADLGEAGYDGAAFAASYRLMRYPEAAGR